MSSSLAPDLQGFFLLLSLLAWSSGLLFIWWLLILSSKLLLAEARFNFCFLPPEDPKLAPALTYTITPPPPDKIPWVIASLLQRRSMQIK